MYHYDFIEKSRLSFTIESLDEFVQESRLSLLIKLGSDMLFGVVSF